MNWQRAWIIVAGLLVIAAGVLLWRNNLSAAFVTAALGACAWFLSYRSELRAKLPDDEDVDEDEISAGDDGDRVQNDHES